MKKHPGRAEIERGLMYQPPYSLDADAQAESLAAIREVCAYRGWELLAAHVRETHMHVIVEAEIPPERIMNTFKSYVTRRLNRVRLDGPVRKRWARHGSTRWLWTDEDVREAIRYVVDVQGAPMAVFVGGAQA